MSRISIDPITRLEGHGKIEIFLDQDGKVENAYFQVPELRGFEQFCVGRLAEDMPVITNRICGVCPEAHHLASVKALDALFGVEPPPAAVKIREMFYMAFFVTDHTTHFYALGGPDFIVGPDAPASERNILGVIRKLGIDAGRKVIECRARNHDVIKMLGGRGIHPVAGVPGGWSKQVTAEMREEIIDVAQENIEFALFTLNAFEQIVLNNSDYMELITSDLYMHRTHSMGTVDPAGRLNFYDGDIRVIDPDGVEVTRYHPSAYLENIAERVEPWTYLKFPYLKQKGWKGLVDGADSGVYMATPLARLNVTDGMPTPRAHEEFEKMYTSLGSTKIDGDRFKPVHHRLATHWARLIELLYASERMLELALDEEILSPVIRRIPDLIIGEGIGSVEAPRGTLTHHYVTDDNGVLTKVNMIVGTTNNYAPMSMSIKRAAEGLINGIDSINEIDDGLLNKVEMAFRLYDPCLSCATHSMPGQMDLEVRIRDNSGRILKRITRK
jgi:F420-non-reducing hydrogenase large subunit